VRYYRIEITDPANPGPAQVYTSWVNGKNDPGALNVQFNISTMAFEFLRNTAVLQIQGIPIKSISQANNLNNKNIKISGGFQKGLPLANPTQNGVLINGYIAQAFGNWLGNDMTLDLILKPGSSPTTPASTQPATAQSSAIVAEPLPPPLGSMTQPINGNFSWPTGVQLSVAIREFLKNAFPKYPEPKIEINPNLVLAYSVNGVYDTLPAFAEWVNDFSKKVIGINHKGPGPYPGVQITILPNNAFFVSDGTVPAPAQTQDAKTSTSSASGVTESANSPSYNPKTIAIAFKDMIGQPTWISQGEVQFKCPMRADIHCLDTITFPDGVYPTIAPSNIASPYNYRNTSQQKGTFNVKEINHYGNFRQPTADAWVSLFRCSYIAPALTSSNLG
jgi:hypothetical protein